MAATLSVTVAGDGAATIRGIDGRVIAPFQPAGAANVIFFVQTDCPVSNSYAPEIQRICREYGSRGVGCSLMYEDVDLPGAGSHAAHGASHAAAAGSHTAGSTLDDAVRTHLQEYRYAGIPAAVDRSRAVATRAHASITPQAVVIDRAGEVRYRGRIDNFYASLGKPRQQVTERDLRNALDAILARQPVPKPETEAVGCFIVDPAVLRK
jgi:hypothetical protein